MKKRNRILAILLTAILTLSMLPSEAFATEAVDTGETAAAAVEEVVSSVGEEQDAEATTEYEAQEVEEAEETVTEETETEETSESAADPEAETAVEEATDESAEAVEETEEPEEAAEVAEPAAETEAEVVTVEAAATVEWPVTLESKGGDYTVTATFDESAGLPADVAMKVSEIKKGSDAYQDYYDQALEAIQNNTDKNVELTEARFFDITFYTNDGEVEPTGPVNVSIKYRKAIEVESKDDVHVLHFDDNDNAAPQIMDIETDGRGDKVNEVSFETDGFSVYAVIGTGETGDEARATVNFLQADGTEIKTMYVKNSDDAAALGKIIYDPGAGTVAAGYAFYGWSVDDLKKADGTYYTDSEEYVGSAYTVDTTPKTIAEVRSYIEGLTITEGDVLNVYAMTFTHYTVEYLDSTGTVSVGSGSALVRNAGVDSSDYTVNMGYPTDDTHNFEGWLVEEGLENITDPTGTTADTLFANETDIKIKGNITLKAKAPEGHWLVFDENGKGATYNAPRFYETNEATDDTGLLEMQRKGYTFGGWFTDAACTDGNEFSFGEKLTDTITIYAKWTAVSTANYTILIWKQNLNATGYDFEEAIPLEGTVGNTVDTVTQQGTGDNAYARINNTNYPYTGFHLKEFDQNVVIKPEGNSVVNVYYDRTEYTLTFQIQDYTYTVSTGDNDNSPAKYGDVNGQKARVYWNNGAFRTRNSSSGTVYEGTVYTRSNSQSWQTIKEVTALYQQSISDNFPIEGHTSSRWSPQNSSTYNQVLIYIDVMPAESVTFHENTSSASQKHIYYYTEALEGETVDRTYNGKGFTLYKSLDPNYNFFTEAEDYIDLNGYYKGGQNGTEYPPQGFTNEALTNQANAVWGSNSNAVYVLCYYTRKAYEINFMDGVYVDGRDNPNEEENRGQLHEVNNITYGADISSYNKDEADYYEPTYQGYVLEGWYIDSACTQAYTFTTMPEGGITVYAKWRQIEYRVFLHPMAGTQESDPSLNWGSTSQQMNFRVADGAKISTPEGIRAAFEFYGWYFDEGLSAIYPDSFALHDYDRTYGQYFSDYDKTKDFTDPMDQWGNGATTNSDITGWDDDHDESTPGKDRYWVTKKLDLYARWSQITIGANGINVTYEANGGTNAPTDNLTYKDNSNAVAGAASTPPANTDKVFKHWVVQTWNGSEYVDTATTVLPGSTFTIHVADAKIVDKESGETVDKAIEGHSYVYTIQLRAEYADPEEVTPTHITWYANNGTGSTETSTDIKINEAVDIKVPGGTFTYTNYDFLGWARLVEESDEQGNVTSIGGADPTNLALTLGESDLFLKWDAENGRFLATEKTGSGYSEGDVVEQVAADEKTDYHGMVAVWKRAKFHIYHSATGEVEDLEIPDVPVDLTTYVTTPGYLYGGYYHYDEVDGQRTKGDAYTSNGKELTPTADTYYYLKEVNEGHLRPKLYLIHNELHDDLIQGLYGIVSIDENAYSECGFIIEGTRYEADLAEAGIQVTKEGQEEPVTTITGADFGFDGCPVGLADFTDLIAGDTRIDIKGYYITPDSVVVTGNRIRRIQFPAGDSNYGGMPLFKGWGSGTDQTRTGLVKSTSETTYEAGSSNAANMNAVRMLRISAPSDKIEYRITKAYGSSTEDQIVEGGNNIGKVTYAPKSGYMFAGWYQDAAYTVPADFADVTGDMTIYAEYFKNKDVKLAFKRIGTKNNVTTFTVTVTLNSDIQLENVSVTVEGGNTAILNNRTVKKSGSGKSVKYTTEYKGTIAVAGLAKVDKFTSFVSWDTSDGTVVTGANKKCTYQLGNVIVR